MATPNDVNLIQFIYTTLSKHTPLNVYSVVQVLKGGESVWNYKVTCSEVE